MQIGIYALGLIGGSLLKALQGHELVAVTRNPETLEAAKEYAQVVSDDINALKDCGIIFVCTPMSKTLQVLDELENVASYRTIVADVASVKEFVIKKVRPYTLIGTHPMAGTENTGFEHSFKDLFKGAKWILTPPKGTSQKDIDLLKVIIESTGAKTHIMDAKEHDKAVALISHMPLLLSQALMDCVMLEKNALALASSGFRDMTRLSMTNTELANDMVKMNLDNIVRALKLLNKSLADNFNDSYIGRITELAAFRRTMYDEDGNNTFNL